MNLKEKKKLLHFTSEINKRKRNLPTTVGGNVNWYSHYEEKYGDCLKKLGLNIPYDPATPLLGIFPDETTVLKGICTAVFIAALFAIARTWKQPKCTLTDEWIKKLWHMYTMEYYSARKRNKFEPVELRWMNLEPVTEWSKSERENADIWKLAGGGNGNPLQYSCLENSMDKEA